MALQTSGAISLNQIHVEAGGSSGSQASINDSDIRGLIGKGSGAQMSFSEWYGATAEVPLTSGGTVNGQAQRQQIVASNFISSGGTLRIPSNMWVWSDNTSIAALTVDIPCTIINEGKIIGKGGNGGTGQYRTSTGGAPGSSGGNAIRVTSSGVTITNLSGAYIAGGGGGGAGGNGAQGGGGGGGGAGGGNGGGGRNYGGGSGGALNASGGDSGSTYVPARGGGAGGGGGVCYWDDANGQGGGGGGRILPGVGGAGGDLPGDAGYGTAGGSAGNAGTQGGGDWRNASVTPTGSGGGWGASGGSGGGGSGGSGGSAISKTTSYTLSNSGTIYGST
jgi:hypothetical protein